MKNQVVVVGGAAMAGLLFFAGSSWTNAQNQNAQGQQQQALGVELNSYEMWQWQGRNDTSYSVRLSSIQSVGVQTYLLPEYAVEVTELTVDTRGSVCARFFAISSVQSSSPAAQTVNNIREHVTGSLDTATGVNPADVVSKTYADTRTHTMDFSLRSADEVEDLYESIVESLEDNRGRTVRADSE